jgi:hypothetical protein
MKKTYETPVLDLLVLKTNDFLNTSGDAVKADYFDDDYGSTFGI